MTLPGYRPTDRMVYSQHRHNAGRRNIAFLLTFEEWLTWWLHQLGPDWRLLRGSERWKFVMARFNDAGPYALGNIKCIQHGENITEGCLEVPTQAVIDIFTSNEPYRDMIDRTGVSFATIHDIRGRRRRFHALTEGLEKGKSHGRNGHGDPKRRRAQ